MFVYEVYRLNQLDKQSVDVVVRYSETKRRAVYGLKYLKIGIVIFSVSFVATLALSLTLPYKDCLAK